MVAAGAVFFPNLFSQPSAQRPPDNGAREATAIVWESVELPTVPQSESSYLNTRPDVAYVSSQACQKCHADECASHGRTGMGRSMALVDIAREPPDAQYDHYTSGRRYQVKRKDGQLWHRELLLPRSASDEEVVLAEHPLKYVIGSGRYSLTYAAEIDGFLVESPLTFFAARGAWEMSPGYDTPTQEGFQRPIPEGCLDCHAGRTEAIDGGLHKIRVLEATIGCERCHGPGELHVEKWSREKRSQTNAAHEQLDNTIVNPANLSRDLAEAVCQQCHLRTSAPVVVRGKGAKDFRPGLPLADFRQEYEWRAAGNAASDSHDKSMTVVGHVEQMHLSKCYQSSSEFTCMTCHNPHDIPAEHAAEEYYKAACLRCHNEEACSKPRDERLKFSEGDNCVACHMPQSATQIVHLAFTHHRIGIHDDAEAERPFAASPMPSSARLAPFWDASRFSEYDRRRSLGMAYVEAAARELDQAKGDSYRRRAFEEFTAAKSLSAGDPSMEAALALVSFHLEREGVLEMAQDALRSGSLAPHERCTALALSADIWHGRGEFEKAAAALAETTRLRRRASDWLLLADCQRALGKPEYLDSLERAVRIDTRRADVHAWLEDHYRQKGDTERAAWHALRKNQ